MYSCSICGKPLSWDEFQDSSLPFPCCHQCRPQALKEYHRSRLARLRSNITSHLARAGVPPKYLNSSLDNFETTGGRKKYRDAVQSWVNQYPSQGLFLTGPNGSGKTHLAIAATREIILSGETNCKFVKVPHLLFQIRKALRSDIPDAEETIIKQYLNAKLLLLDELGVEKTTAWTLQTLYLIIDGRDSHMMPTIITSNLSLQGIEDALDPRFASRIVGMCSLLTLNCPDWRLQTHTPRKL